MISEEFDRYGLDKKQPLIGVMVVILTVIWAAFLQRNSPKLPLALAAGLLLGYTLTRSRFGFAGGVKRIFYRGEGSLTIALIVMLATTAVLNFGIQWFAASDGALPAWQITDAATQAIIPGTQNVRIGNISVILGAFLFGMGMIMAGGCASGTLSDFGEGEGHAWVAFPFFVLFAAPGQYLGYVLDNTALGKVGVNIWLPEYVGYWGALGITLAALLALFVFTKHYENKKRAAGRYLDPKSDWLDFEKPIKNDAKTPFRWRSWSAYQALFIRRWPFVAGALGLTIGATFIMITTHKAWGVTTAFVTLDQKFLGLFGLKLTSPAFDETAKAMAGSLLTDSGTVRNIGIVLGALIAFLMAGRFKMKFKMTASDFAGYAGGGALMGLGSRMARGCNIGALYSAITNFSVHGYLFMFFLVLGAAFAIKIFQGKINLCPRYLPSQTKN